MAFRLLKHIPRGVVKVALYLLVAGLLVVFALTRTQVGRDALRQQIEARFSETFAGTLEIGQLEGNLIYSLYASDVILRDTTGNVVVQIDSVVVLAQLRNLLRRRLRFQQFELIGPTAHLVRHADGTWNLSRALSRREADTSQVAISFPPFAATDLRITDGVVTTLNEGTLPPLVAAGTVFDYTNATLDSLQARLTVEWRNTIKQLDLVYLSGHLRDPGVRLHGLQGQLVHQPGALALNQFVVAAPGNNIGASLSLTDFEALRPDGLEQATFNLDLAESNVDFDWWQRLFPKLPIRGSWQVAAQVNGPTRTLQVQRFDLAFGASRLRGDGTLFDPLGDLSFEAALQESQLRWQDLPARLPNVSLPALRPGGPISLGLFVTGSLPRTEAAPTTIRAELLAQAPVGTVDGTLTLRQAPKAPWAYEADLTAEQLDLHRLLGAPPGRTRLNGRLRVGAQGTALADLDGEATLILGPSRLANRRLDSLRVRAEAQAGGLITSTFRYVEGAGTLSGAAQWDARAARPKYQLDATAAALDLGPLLAADTVETSLFAALRFAGSGQRLNQLAGDLTVTVDSGTVRIGADASVLPPHQHQAQWSPRGSLLPRFQLDGDLAQVVVDGAFSTPVLAATGEVLWASLQQAAEQVRQNRRYGSDTLRQASALALGVPQLLAARQRLQETFRQEARASLALNAEVLIHRAELLATYFPALPTVGTDLRASLALVATPTHIEWQSTALADSLYLPAFGVDSLDAEWSFSARLDTAVAATAQSYFAAKAQTIRYGDTQLPFPTLSVTYAEKRGHLDARAGRGPALGPFRLRGRFNLLKNETALSLDEVFLAAENLAWENATTGTLRWYSDAVVTEDLVFSAAATDTSAAQFLSLTGTYSDHPNDTLRIRAEQILLHPFSDFMRFKKRLQGVLNGEIAYAGGRRAPRVLGNLGVRALRLEDRVLGDLHLESRYIPGVPDIALEATLLPPTPTRTPTQLSPQGDPLFIEENTLRLAGTIRLPEQTPRVGAASEGALNLRLEVERADLFFFEYFFNEALKNVRGFAQGTIAITGPPTRPVFQADARVVDGYMEIPKFNLAYHVDGPVLIDAEGIKPQNVSVTDTTGGSLLLNGAILFNDYRFFSYDLVGELDELLIMDVAASSALPFYGHIWVSGPVTLSGPQSNTFLRAPSASISPQSQVFVPVAESVEEVEEGFIIFADSTGAVPDLRALTFRPSLINSRPVGERPFLDGMDMDLDLFAPTGTTLHLVIDPLLGDVINAVGTGRVQIERTDGEYLVFGSLDVNAGDYLFTAGDVFSRRFLIEDGGSITWDGDPLNAQLNIPASYRTRASTAGLPGAFTDNNTLIPLIVELNISGRVQAPEVDLRLSIDQSDRDRLGAYQSLESVLNQTDRATEYATSVLLTNSFLLTTESAPSGQAFTSSAFNSVSQLVASQVTRFVNQALPNVDLNFGVQGESTQDLDVTYGVALRLLDERLIIRGEAIYQAARADQASEAGGAGQAGTQGEFVVEVRLSPSVSVEVFYRRENVGLLGEEGTLTTSTTTGAGLSYRTEFPTWRRFFRRLFGWMLPQKDEEPAPAEAPVVAEDQ